MAAEKRPGYHPGRKNNEGKKPTLKQQGFYRSRAWRSVRLVALQRDHYLCQNCLRKKRFTRATEVHHIRPLEDFPELGLEVSNLLSLCWRCHEETKDHGGCAAVMPAGVKVIKITDEEDCD